MVFNTYIHGKCSSNDRIVETNLNVSHPARLICHTQTHVSHHVNLKVLLLTLWIYGWRDSCRWMRFHDFRILLIQTKIENEIFRVWQYSNSIGSTKKWHSHTFWFVVHFQFYKANHLPNVNRSSVAIPSLCPSFSRL